MPFHYLWWFTWKTGGFGKVFRQQLSVETTHVLSTMPSLFFLREWVSPSFPNLQCTTVCGHMLSTLCHCKQTAHNPPCLPHTHLKFSVNLHHIIFPALLGVWCHWQSSQVTAGPDGEGVASRECCYGNNHACSLVVENSLQRLCKKMLVPL